jgi:hypothetical protein
MDERKSHSHRRRSTSHASPFVFSVSSSIQRLILTALRKDQAQGANQAIEDAGALSVFLANVQRLEDIPSRLELVQNTRRDRAAAMQIFSNAGQDQAAEIENEARQYVKGPIPSEFCL